LQIPNPDVVETSVTHVVKDDNCISSNTRTGKLPTNLIESSPIEIRKGAGDDSNSGQHDERFAAVDQTQLEAQAFEPGNAGHDDDHNTELDKGQLDISASEPGNSRSEAEGLRELHKAQLKTRTLDIVALEAEEDTAKVFQEEEKEDVVKQISDDLHDSNGESSSPFVNDNTVSLDMCNEDNSADSCSKANTREPEESNQNHNAPDTVNCSSVIMEEYGEMLDEGDDIQKSSDKLTEHDKKLIDKSAENLSNGEDNTDDIPNVETPIPVLSPPNAAIENNGDANEPFTENIALLDTNGDSRSQSQDSTSYQPVYTYQTDQPIFQIPETVQAATTVNQPFGDPPNYYDPHTVAMSSICRSNISMAAFQSDQQVQPTQYQSETDIYRSESTNSAKSDIDPTPLVQPNAAIWNYYPSQRQQDVGQQYNGQYSDYHKAFDACQQYATDGSQVSGPQRAQNDPMLPGSSDADDMAAFNAHAQQMYAPTSSCQTASEHSADTACQGLEAQNYSTKRPLQHPAMTGPPKRKQKKVVIPAGMFRTSRNFSGISVT